MAKSATTTPKETASPKKTKWRPSADEAWSIHNTRKVLLSRMCEESGDELFATVHAYERLLKLDRHG